MNHRDHVALIEGGVGGAGGRWLELGAGNGEFTLALAQCLGEGGEIVAVDLDRWALDDLDGRVSSRFPGVLVETSVLDFTEGMPAGPFDGVLAANSLHFTTDPVAVLRAARDVLAAGRQARRRRVRRRARQPVCAAPDLGATPARDRGCRRLHRTRRDRARAEPVPRGDLRGGGQPRWRRPRR